MQALLAVSRVIDAINTRLGKWLAWAILAAVIISAGNAVVRLVPAGAVVRVARPWR